MTGTDVASEDIEYNAPVEDFYHATASSFIGENVSTQTMRDVSDAETQLYKMIEHIAVQILHIMTIRVHKQSLILFIVRTEAHKQISVPY